MYRNPLFCITDMLQGKEQHLRVIRYSRTGLLRSMCVVALLFCVLIPAKAQVGILLQQDILTRSDTVWVDVRIEIADSSTYVRPISAYQFEVHTSSGIRFTRSDESYSLTDRNGWTSGFNAENGKVGAFSSSVDAIRESGVLVRLQFILVGTDTSEEVELHDFRLNSGDPEHKPTVPVLRLELSSHKE